MSIVTLPRQPGSHLRSASQLAGAMPGRGKNRPVPDRDRYVIAPTTERPPNAWPVPSRDDRFASLWTAHHQAVLAYTRRRAGADDAEEATNATFAVLWRRIDDPPREPLPWLYSVARGQLANQRRGHARRAALGRRLFGGPIPIPVAPDDADGVADRMRARSALANLSPSDREILMLVAWEGLDPPHAAAALGISPTTFAVRLHRARRRLEHHLSEPKESR